MRRDKLLMVSSGIPPRTSGSAIIVLNFLKQFKKEEMVVVGEYASGYPDVKWLKQWPKRYFASFEYKSRWRGARFVRWLQFPLILLTTLYIAIKERATIVLGVYPFDQYLFASWITAKVLDLRYYSWFHNTYLEARSFEGKHYFQLITAGFIQKRVFQDSKVIFTMSEGMNEYYTAKYPGNVFLPLVHTYNELVSPYTAKSLQSPYTIAMSGNINNSCYDAAKRLVDCLPKLKDFRVQIYSGQPESELNRLGMIKESVAAQSLTRDQLIERLKEADILYLPHGLHGKVADIEYKTIFPTRTIEYLLAGRPILAHAPNDSFLARFLNKNKCALVVTKPDQDSLIAALNRLVSDSSMCNELVQNAQITAKMFYAPHVVEEFKKVINIKN